MKKKSDYWIIGINAYHGDSAACILHNGKVLAAAEEERFCRVKHWGGFPINAIDYCLNVGGIRLSDVDVIAINSDPKSNLLRKLWFLGTNKLDFQYILKRFRNQRAKYSVDNDLNALFSRDKFNGVVSHIEHHAAHLASSYFVSSFDNALVLSVDGFGDFASCAWGVGKENRIDIKGKIYFPHSLGVFYQAMTQYLGFSNFGDEYKVMGLAPYGKPNYINELEKVVGSNPDGTFCLNLKYFRHHCEDVNYSWKDGEPKVDAVFSQALCDLLGPVRSKNDPLNEKHFDMAYSTQMVYEKIFLNMLCKLHKKYPNENIALAGGCAMNSVANGKVLENTPFKNIYIPAAAGDAGGAIGAALVAWNKIKSDNSHKSSHVADHAYLGPQFSDHEIEILLKNHSSEFAKNACDIECVNDLTQLCELTANAIAKGEVIGWFQGRMEWGPRALGNRSILGDPRRSNMKDILNLKIKRRESFRPFAPSILREDVCEWFTQDYDVPFMMQVFKIKEEKKTLIPAVTHVDGSGRLQTVHFETNPSYYTLIKCFEKITGVPIVLNTSFNENEPIVCRPEEALDCFLRTKMDMLVLGHWVVRRRSLQQSVEQEICIEESNG